MPDPNLFRPQQFIFEGKMPNSVSGAKKYRDEQGNRYIVKRNNNFPFLIANEVITASIAEAIGLNVASYNIGVVEGQLSFIAGFIDGQDLALKRWYDIQGRYEKPSDFLKLGCLDILVVNRDRHFSNIKISGEEGSLTIHPIDHDRALLNGTRNIDHFERKHVMTASQLLREEQIRLLKEAVLFGNFTEPIACCESLSDTQIENIVYSIDSQFLDELYKARIVEILKERKRHIGDYVSELITVRLTA